MQERQKGKATAGGSRLKELGRRARDRLQEERDKRREIVHLNETLLPPKNPPRQSIDGPAKKRPKSVVAATVTSPPVSSPAETASTPWVRATRFPPEASVLHVKQFFRGLDVLQLMWNAVVQQNKSEKSQSSTFCLWVRFPSAVVATLALARSSERIAVETRHTTIDVLAVSADEYTRVKDILVDASWWWNKQGKPDTSFGEMRATLSGDLHPAVLPLLSAKTRKDKFRMEDIPGWADLRRHSNPPDMTMCLRKLKEELEHPLPFGLTPTDPTVTLTAAAIHVLQTRLDQLDRQALRDYRLSFLEES
jgi:hypothetical protein